MISKKMEIVATLHEMADTMQRAAREIHAYAKDIEDGDETILSTADAVVVVQNCIMNLPLARLIRSSVRASPPPTKEVRNGQPT